MKLSVMLITYNHERYIAQAIQSVLDQRTNFDYEIVIGEDCSTDRTREIVMEFHRLYPDRIVPILRDENAGMMRNFMEVLAACRGEYVAILEGDDYWTCPDKVQRQVDFLEANPDYAICCGRALVLDQMGLGLPAVLPANAAGPHSIENLLTGNFIMTSTVVYRWGALGHFPSWFREIAMGDWPLHVLMSQFGKIHLMNEVFSVYRVHSGGVWSSRSPVRRLKATIRMLAALDEELGFRYTNIIRRTMTDCYIEWGRIAQQNRNRVEASKCLICWLCNGGAKTRDVRPKLKGLGWYALLGSWHPAFAKAKRAILG